MQKPRRLELTWVGKYDEKVVEPRILLEDKEKSYGDPTSENMLIHGDNLIALQALQQDFAGKIKCIYIDPPYNTGSAFEYYDDGLEHSQWLSLLRPRIELLKNLLTEDGSLWISIDDYEQAYLKVLCDEVFGRRNFVTTIIWQMRTTRENRRTFSNNHEYILVYAKDSAAFAISRNEFSINDEIKARYKNPDNDPRGPWQSVSANAQAGHGTASQFYTLVAPNGKRHDPPKGRCWLYTEKAMAEKIADNRIWFGKDGNGAPRVKKYLSEVTKGITPDTLWKAEDAGTNDEAKKDSLRLFDNLNVFDTPKPEKLIERIIHIASNPRDIVLDSFLGSGTTAAVAHKMKRWWIGIEMGNHAYSHCKLRLDKVIDGTDSGGITTAVGWQGGGGYHFYELAPSLLVKNNKLPIYQINPSFTFEMLCEAICKIEGFRYKPQDVFHGYSSEKRFIHITMEFVNAAYVKSLSARLGEGQSLLIYGTKIQSDMILPDYIEVKKIPKDLLEKCDFESEVE